MGVCSLCDGTGKCQGVCRGTGDNGSGPGSCGACHGTGKCSNCGGSGRD